MGKTGQDDPAPTNTRAKGADAEDVAAEYLIGQGFTIVERNFQLRQGEIDIIARDKDNTLVFVEVKSTNTPFFGHPFSWITPGKRRTLTTVARVYLANVIKGYCPCRFDAIAITRGKLEHLRNAFLAG